MTAVLNFHSSPYPCCYKGNCWQIKQLLGLLFMYIVLDLALWQIFQFFCHTNEQIDKINAETLPHFCLLLINLFSYSTLTLIFLFLTGVPLAVYLSKKKCYRHILSYYNCAILSQTNCTNLHILTNDIWEMKSQMFIITLMIYQYT